MERAALSPREFAAVFGKSQTWGYRQIYAGKVNAITEVGRILIPFSEIEKILGTADRYSAKKKASPTGEKKRQQRDLRDLMRRAQEIIAKRGGAKKAAILPKAAAGRLASLSKRSQPPKA